MEQHKQILIEHGDRRAVVDKHIAGFILEMWKTDIFRLLS